MFGDIHVGKPGNPDVEFGPDPVGILAQRLQQIAGGLHPSGLRVGLLQAARLVEQQQQIAGLLRGQARAATGSHPRCWPEPRTPDPPKPGSTHRRGPRWRSMCADTAIPPRSKKLREYPATYNVPAHNAICHAPTAIPSKQTASTTQYRVEVHVGAEGDGPRAAAGVNPAEHRQRADRQRARQQPSPHRARRSSDRSARSGPRAQRRRRPAPEPPRTTPAGGLRRASADAIPDGLEVSCPKASRPLIGSNAGADEAPKASSARGRVLRTRPRLRFVGPGIESRRETAALGGLRRRLPSGRRSGLLLRTEVAEVERIRRCHRFDLNTGSGIGRTNGRAGLPRSKPSGIDRWFQPALRRCTPLPGVRSRLGKGRARHCLSR